MKLLALTPALPLISLPKVPKADEFKEVQLLYSHVAGGVYYDMANELEDIENGEVLILKREPSNRYDRRAIEIYRQNGAKLGYVKRIRNTTLANLMDAGVALTAKVAPIEEDPSIFDLPYIVEMKVKE